MRGIDGAEVREPGHETEHEDAILRRRLCMATTSSAFQAPEARHVVDVGAELLVVTDRDLDAPDVATAYSSTGRPQPDRHPRRKPFDVGRQRIEVHRHGPEGRHDVTNAGTRAHAQVVGQRDRAGVHVGVDPVLELRDQHGVARRDDANAVHCAGSDCRAASRRL